MVVLIVGRRFISPITVMTRNHLDMDVSLKSHSARLSKKRKKRKKKKVTLSNSIVSSMPTNIVNII